MLFSSEGLKELCDLLGHAAISYVAYQGVKAAGSSYFKLVYAPVSINAVAPPSTLFLVAASTMHFAKAALFSAAVMIERQSMGGFFTPAIAVGGTLLAYTLANYGSQLSDFTKKSFYISAGLEVLVIGSFAGVAAFTTTLGEHIDFDYTLVNLADTTETWQGQLLHTAGLERVTVGSLTSMTIFSLYSIYAVYSTFRQGCQ